MKFSIIVAALVCITFGAAPAVAEDCPPLKLFASVDLTLDHDARQPLVPVEIAGVPKLMVLDTGASVTLITELAADQLKLDKRRANARAYSLTGSYTEWYTTAPLTVGNLKGGSINFMVDPNFNGMDPDGKVIGLLGSDILSNFDVSVDFGTGKLDLLDQRHCEGKVVYWPHPVLAVVPFKRMPSRSIVVELLLDGKPVKAILDTGAYNSTLRVAAAERLFDIKPGSPDTPAIGGLNSRQDLTTYKHKFQSLTFEGIQVSNPEITLIPDMLSKKLGSAVFTGSNIPTKNDELAPDLLLGMNVLRHLHLYVAYKEQKLYITPAGAPPASAPKAN